MRLISIIFTFSFLFSFGQVYENVEQLTKQLYSQSDNDSIKTIKICKWITENIEFDTKVFKTQTLKTNQEIIKSNLL